VNLNTIIVCASGDRLEDWVEIALLPDAEILQDSWGTPERATGEVMEVAGPGIMILFWSHGDLF
jgi:hypothetical protein